MDRMVAAGWFDIMLVDLEHKFVNYTHNVPSPSLRSNNSSDLSGGEDNSSIFND